MGRIDHVFHDGVSDSGVCQDRLAEIETRLPEVYVELKCGDVVMFHCNNLHGSNDNLSPKSRIALIGCYNTKANNPYKSAGGHPFYQAQERVLEKITEQDSRAFLILICNVPDFTSAFVPKGD